MQCGRIASCHTAGTDLPNKEQVQSASPPPTGEADEGHMAFLDSTEKHW